MVRRVGGVEVEPRSAQATDAAVWLVQLPFPSQADPLPVLVDYYARYLADYARVFPEYAIAAGDLWEAPLWVAHLDGALGRADTGFLDLSRAASDPDAIADAIAARAGAGALVFLSPLAQNFALAIEVSRRLRARALRTVVGGNMADLASTDDFTHVYTGLVQGGLYERITRAAGGQLDNVIRLGKAPAPLPYRPAYRHLSGFAGRVPLLRVHASHGCLFACAFCGDGWSRQLHLVAPELLADELAELRRLFPATRLLYIGDKTFGQSREAVANLRRVLGVDGGATAPAHAYRLIVQTHVSIITPALADDLCALGVEVVEIGFESASSTVLEELRKYGGARAYRDAIELLHARGLRVILNVLGGLPNETADSHARTRAFLEETGDQVWLYNLYNFVPYPKTPLFATLRPRIVDWNFQNWREDQPVVFEPYHHSRAQAWDNFLALVETADRLIQRRGVRA